MGISVDKDVCTPALAERGSNELKKQFLEPSIRGDYVGCIGVSEPDAGSEVASIRPGAPSAGEEWGMNGPKPYITNGNRADWVGPLDPTRDASADPWSPLVSGPTL